MDLGLGSWPWAIDHGATAMVHVWFERFIVFSGFGVETRHNASPSRSTAAVLGALVDIGIP